MRAWIFQDPRQKRNLDNKAPWSVGWLEGQQRPSKKIGTKTAAREYARKLEGGFAAGTYFGESRKKWADFRAEYEQRIADGMKPETRRTTLEAVDHFERICKVGPMGTIKTQTIDVYIAKRRTERGRKKGDTVSPATLNKELRHLKAVLNVAHEWEYLPKMPKIRMLREPKKLIRYVTADHFAEIYKACGGAQRPFAPGQPYTAAEWWQGILVMTYMTGWRIGEPLALRREDLDLDEGTAITQHSDNKGESDELVPLHDVVVNHLRRLVSFSPIVFVWPHAREQLWVEFMRIQQAAGIHLQCAGKHEHTASCHVYGFHDSSPP